MTTTAPRVRRALPDDAARLAVLGAETFRATFARDNAPEDLDRYLSASFGPDTQHAELVDPAVDTLLVEVQGTLAGYAQLRLAAPPVSDAGPDAIELRRFYVEGRWHGRGLAHALMEHVLSAAATRGADVLWLGVWERNVRAIRFYRKCRFLDVGSQVFVLGSDRQTDRVMLRPLPRPGRTMRAPERLFTDRLALRRPRSADAEEVFSRYASDGEVTRYLSWPRHRTLEDTRTFLAFSDAEWVRWSAGPYLVRARDTGLLLGSAGLSLESAECATTGYVLAREAWGRGYASEALGASVDVARAIGMRRLQALCHVDHAASARVLEKGGFSVEATLRAHTVLPNLIVELVQPAVASDVNVYVRAL